MDYTQADLDYLAKMEKELVDCAEVLKQFSDNFYEVRSAGTIVFEGNFTLALIGDDVVHAKALSLKQPPYELGHYGEYFEFRLDKPNVKTPHWGNFGWYTTSPDNIVEMRNANKILQVKKYRGRVEYKLVAPQY